MQEDRTQEGVQEGGKPEEASPVTEQATTDGVIPIDVTKKYKHPRHPEEEIGGDELYATYQRGLQFDPMQGRAHKAEAKVQDLETQLADAQTQLRSSEQRQSVIDSLSELGFADTGVRAGAVRTQESAEDDWYGTPESRTSERADILKNHGMAELIRKVIRDEISAATGGVGLPEHQEQLIADNVRAIYATDQQHREAQQKRKRAIDKIRAAQIANLRQKYPDIDPARLEAIVDRKDAALGNTVKSIDQSVAGDDYASYETYLDGLEQDEAALDARLAIMLEQRELDAERERDAELESLSGGGLPSEDVPRRKTRFRRKEVEDARAEGKERGKTMTDRRRAIKNSGM
jgi:hypothetical protein